MAHPSISLPICCRLPTAIQKHGKSTSIPEHNQNTQYWTYPESEKTSKTGTQIISDFSLPDTSLSSHIWFLFSIHLYFISFLPYSHFSCFQVTQPFVFVKCPARTMINVTTWLFTFFSIFYSILLEKHNKVIEKLLVDELLLDP